MSDRDYESDSSSPAEEEKEEIMDDSVRKITISSPRLSHLIERRPGRC